MRGQLTCFGSFSEKYRGIQPWEMPEGATAEQLATRVGLDVEEVKIVFVNHREVELSHVLHDGDKVAMSPKTGGM